MPQALAPPPRLLALRCGEQPTCYGEMAPSSGLPDSAPPVSQPRAREPQEKQLCPVFTPEAPPRHFRYSKGSEKFR